MTEIAKVFVKETMVIARLFHSEEISAFIVSSSTGQTQVFDYLETNSGASKVQALCSASQQLQSFL